ncbi:MAG: hypothetical protein KatS3mg056_1007 [Chloroflexus sp.]|nr:MAG: hypothetical protein KatS3mg056_1007 [Chloroflexus sp.]
MKILSLLPLTHKVTSMRSDIPFPPTFRLHRVRMTPFGMLPPMAS